MIAPAFVVALFALAASAAAPADPVEAFAARVRLEPGLPEAQEAVLRRAVRAAASTPTGREYAARFVAGGWTVRLGTGTLGLSLIESQGRPGMDGTAGDLNLGVSPPLVRIDSVLISSSPETVFDTVAHEILGHALSHFEAKKAGVAEAWKNSAEDEMLAELVGDVILRESGRPMEDFSASAGELFVSTQAYIRLQWFGVVGHPGQYSVDEVAAPAAALEARLYAQSEEYWRLEKIRDEIKLWRRRIVHFTGVHGEPAANYVALWSYVDDMQAANDARRKSLEEAREAVYDHLRYLFTSEGLRIRRRLASPRYLAFARERSREMTALQARLAALGAGEAPAVAAGRVSHTDDAWDALIKKCEDDQKKNPGHWR